jgi:ribosomal protein L37AE/L43A
MNGWLCVSLDKSNIAYAGNDGYNEELGVYYSWDSTVKHHGRISVGDVIVIWNKLQLLGWSVIDRIDTGVAIKKFFTCPKCKNSAIKARKTLSPIYRCQDCRTTFDKRIESEREVKVYKAFYESGWVSVNTFVSGARCRLISQQPKAQDSLRKIDSVKFKKLVEEFPKIATSRYRRRAAVIAGGHHLRTVRVRKGQQKFRDRLIKQFGYVCAFSGKNHSTALEAAHLYQYSEYGEHHDGGGLLIRRDIHSLFDENLITVDPKTLVIEVHEDLKNIQTYKELIGRKLQVKVTAKTKAWLETHWETFHG